MRLRLIGASCALLAGGDMAAAAPLAPAEIQSTFFNGEPFTSSTPQNIKYTMVFTADGKMTRAAARQGRRQGRRHLEAQQGRLLHHLEELGRQLLQPGRQRRQEMVGHEGHRCDRHLVEVTPAS